MHQSLLWVFFVSSDTFFLSLSRSSRCCGFFSISSWLENCSSLSKSVFAFISLYRIDSSIFTWKMAAYYITLESCSIPNLTNNSVRLDSHRLCKLLSCVYCIKWHFARPHTHTHTHSHGSMCIIVRLVEMENYRQLNRSLKVEIYTYGCIVQFCARFVS